MNNLYHIPSSSSQKSTTIMSGRYGSRHFEIITYNGHPDAYVSFPEGASFNGDYDAVETSYYPHGGFTFLGWRRDLLMLGWDYIHYDDFDANHPTEGGYMWDLAEICTEVIRVIDALNSTC